MRTMTRYFGEDLNANSKNIIDSSHTDKDSREEGQVWSSFSESEQVSKNRKHACDDGESRSKLMRTCKINVPSYYSLGDEYVCFP